MSISASTRHSHITASTRAYVCDCSCTTKRARCNSGRRPFGCNTSGLHMGCGPGMDAQRDGNGDILEVLDVAYVQPSGDAAVNPKHRLDLYLPAVAGAQPAGGIGELGAAQRQRGLRPGVPEAGGRRHPLRPIVIFVHGTCAIRNAAPVGDGEMLIRAGRCSFTRSRMELRRRAVARCAARFRLSSHTSSGVWYHCVMVTIACLCRTADARFPQIFSRRRRMEEW
jgi:hypothetical protein